MFDRVQRYWVLRFLLGLSLLLACGGGLPGELLRGSGDAARPFWLANFVLGLYGFWFALRAVTPMVRSLAEDRHLRREWGAAAHDAFAQATTARQVFLLLLTVAEAEGGAGAAARVRRFLLQRFTDPGTAAELPGWEAQAVPIRNLAQLARRVARGLGPGDLTTLYTWSCLVALGDGELTAAAHDALRQVARGLGLIDAHARLLFMLAQQSRPGSGTQAAPGPRRTSQSQRSRPGTPAAAAAPTARDRALATLGLTATATPAMIRKRHRELVRRFHPDAQPGLGPVAQQEAGERFREIQLAYEALTS